MSKPKRIDTLWAWVSQDHDGEGICSALLPNGTWAPLIAADEERLRSLRPIVEDIAKESGVPIHLVRFTTRHDLETIK